MNLVPPGTARVQGHHLRSGTAARLAGLPVTTLRVWERRYGIAGADNRTASGQRLYSPDDVARLRLLRQLTQQGHAIGSIASLELRSLEALGQGLSAADESESDTVVAAVVVGRGAAQALRSVPGCLLQAVYDSLDDAESTPAEERGARLLVVRLASLQPADVDRLARLGTRLGRPSLLVIYGFGTDASAEALRRAGATVLREPLGERELLNWVRRVRTSRPTGGPVEDALALAGADPVGAVLPRRFGDEALAQLTRTRSPVACECLRHMAEIVAQLAGFERYSHDCVSTDLADVALHRQLATTAGLARTMFEHALQRVVDHADLELPSASIG